MKKITVLGAGTWGSALAEMLFAENGCETTLWSALPSELEEIAKTGKHPKMPELSFSQGIILQPDIEKALLGAEIVMFAVPSPYVRETAEKAKPYIGGDAILVDVAKGLERGTKMTLCQVIKDVLGEEKGGIVALSGPTHAEEVAGKLPTAIVAASENEEAAKIVQQVFSNGFFRVYTNTDIKGIEICGAMKNIIAIAAGISAGLGYGDNAKAAIITRGMAEITRLGEAMGASHRTFESLAGIGDLVVTCTSLHSRNNRAGMLIGKGYRAEEAVKEIGMAVEGLNALPAAIEFAKDYNVELPICELLYRVVNGEIVASEALHELMMRSLKSEV